VVGEARGFMAGRGPVDTGGTGIAVAQAMDMGVLLDAAGIGCQAEGALEGGTAHGACGGGGTFAVVALAGADVEEHALGVDVAHLQVEGFAQAQAAGVGGGEGDAMIEGGDGGEDVADLGGPGAAQGLLPEHLDGADGLGGGGTVEAPLSLEVEEVLAQLLGVDLLGGFVEVLGELSDAGEVGLLCPGQEGEEAQVVGEAD